MPILGYTSCMKMPSELSLPVWNEVPNPDTSGCSFRARQM